MAGRILQRRREAALPIDVHFHSVLAALADPVRLRIFLLVRQREQCVCHLTDALGLSQGTVSHHMGILKRAGLVTDRRDQFDARWVYYRLDLDGVRAAQSALGQLLDVAAVDLAPAACCSDLDCPDNDSLEEQ